MSSSPESQRSMPEWQSGDPYETALTREAYACEKRLLQIELLKLQAHITRSSDRVLILFEGRDAAGKGGAITRFMEHLNPRGARVVALDKPTDAERTQWYFQRYVAHLPSGGEIVMMDRSWYNRAGVERVMGYCSSAEYEEFIQTVPEFERMLVSSGIRLVKLWFSIDEAEQRRRFAHRAKTPSRSGSSARPTSRASTAGTSTSQRRRRCSSGRTPLPSLGPSSRRTTRGARGWRR